MNKFIKADAQMKAALDLMESSGVLSEIKAQAIEEAVRNDQDIKSFRVLKVVYSSKLKG